MDKVEFKGTIQSIQPRIRLTRSFDESSHDYLGYSIILSGWLDDGRIQTSSDHEEKEQTGRDAIFSVGIGKVAQEKHQFKVGDVISGECSPVVDERMESVEFYKVSKLKIISDSVEIAQTSPPWLGIPPSLETYRERGARRLAAKTYEMKCVACIWGCRMPVEIIVDNWNPGKRKYRFETFCYGPLSCRLYKSGLNRKVEGRNGMVYVEEDWVDEEMTGHREKDE